MRETLDGNYPNVFLFSFLLFALSFDLKFHFTKRFVQLLVLYGLFFDLILFSSLFVVFRDRKEFLNNHIDLKSMAT